jgi:elongation factor Ts
MEVSMEQVKKLREKTGAGILDCKNALAESGGDFEKAIEYLRKKGAATSQKRSNRIAKEGLIIAQASENKKEAVIVEVNCETDFVARSSDFQNFTKEVVNNTFQFKKEDLATLLEVSVNGKSLHQSFDELTGKVGEKIEVKRVKFLSSNKSFFACYNHLGNKVASVVELEGEVTDKGLYLGNELAMQVVAMKPIAIDRTQIDTKILEQEKEIYLTQAKNEKKPDDIAEKIANNKIEKYFQENCLIEQEYIKDPVKSVKDFINEIRKESGINYNVKTMIRYQLGETLEN